MEYFIIEKRPTLSLYWRSDARYFSLYRDRATRYKSKAAAKGALTRMLNGPYGFCFDRDYAIIEAEPFPLFDHGQQLTTDMSAASKAAQLLIDKATVKSSESAAEAPLTAVAA